MTLLPDLEDFCHDHRPHGTLIDDAIEPTRNGYRLIVTCPCGAVFKRWVTREDAAEDTLREHLLAIEAMTSGEIRG